MGHIIVARKHYSNGSGRDWRADLPETLFYDHGGTVGSAPFEELLRNSRM